MPAPTASATDATGSDRATGDSDQFRPLRWGRVLVLLWAVSLALVLASYLLPTLTRHPIWSSDGLLGTWLWVDEEDNLPTWWSAALLVTAAVLHLVMAWLARRTLAGGVVAWLVLATFMSVMSLDEVAQVHENGNLVFGEAGSATFERYHWLVIGIPVAVAVVAVVAVSALRLPPPVRLVELVAFVVFFAGAIGLEVVGDEVLQRGLEGTGAEAVVHHVEELLEMWGSSLMVAAGIVGVRLRTTASGLELHLAGRGNRVTPSHGRRRRRRPASSHEQRRPS